MNHALPSESYIARLDYLAFNGKVCSSVAYSDEQRFLEDLKESLYITVMSFTSSCISRHL